MTSDLLASLRYLIIVFLFDVLLGTNYVTAEDHKNTEQVAITPGEFHSIKIDRQSIHPILIKLSNFGVDCYLELNNNGKVQKIASWRGADGIINAIIALEEIASIKVTVATAESRGAPGHYSIEVKPIDLSNKRFIENEKNTMKALDEFFRSYSGEANRLPKAKNLLKKSLAYWLDERSDQDIGRIAYHLAYVAFDMGLYSESADNFNLAQKHWTKASRFDDAAAALNLRGLSFDKLGRYDEAIAQYEEAKNLRVQISELEKAAISDNNIALIYLKRGEVFRAVDVFKNSALTFGLSIEFIESSLPNEDYFKNEVERLKNSKYLKHMVSIINNLADAYLKMGRFEISLRYRLVAKDVSSAMSDKREVYLIKNNFAETLAKNGKLEESLKQFEQLEVELKQKEMTPILALVYKNVGDIYLDYGLFELATNKYESALALREKQKNVKRQADLLLALAKASNHKKNGNDKARSYLTKAEKIYKKSKVKDRHRQAIGMLSEIDINEGKLSNARKLLSEAIESANTDNDELGLAELKMVEGYLERKSGNIDSAIKSYELSNEIYSSNLDFLKLSSGYFELSKLFKSKSDISTAIKMAESALDNLSYVSVEMLSADRKANFLSRNSEVYKELIYLYYKAGSQDKSIRLLQQFKSSTLGEWGVSFESIDQKNKFEELRTSFESKISAFNRIRGPKASKNQSRSVESRVALKDELSKDLANIRNELDKILSKNRTKSKRKISSTLDLSDDEILVEYFLYNPISLAFVYKNNGLEVIELPSEEEINTYVDDVRYALKSHDYRSWIKATNTFSNELLSFLPKAKAKAKDASADSKSSNLIQRLIIVPDGSLSLIPFASLPYSQKSIINKFEVSMGLSSKIVSTNSTNLDLSKSTIAVFYDPVYQVDDPRMPAAKPTSSASNLSLVNYQVATRSGLSLSRLKESDTEAREIMALSPANTKLISGHDVNKDTVLSEKYKESNIWHFATHGVPNESSSMMSGLELSRYDKSGKSIPSLLSGMEVATMQLSQDLVVLSACETNIGKFYRGEGFLGLSRWFIEAGAKNVVSSLWKVDDKATSVLMAEFYRQLIKEKQPPATALRRAQLYMKNQSRWRDPYYWAGFIIQSGVAK